MIKAGNGNWRLIVLHKQGTGGNYKVWTDQEKEGDDLAKNMNTMFQDNVNVSTVCTMAYTFGNDRHQACVIYKQDDEAIRYPGAG